MTPWASSYHNGVLLHLDVTGEGAAIGRFAGSVSFMLLRQQRTPFGWLSTQPEVTYRHTSTTAAYDLAGQRRPAGLRPVWPHRHRRWPAALAGLTATPSALFALPP